MEVDRDLASMVRFERESKFPINVTECLTKRDLHDKNRHCKTRKSKYHNPYQLLETVKLNQEGKADLNQIETNEDGPRPAADAECLGFSPDGKYMVFHTHSKSAITLCCYSGVESARPADEKPFASDYVKESMFSHSEIFPLSNFPCFDPGPVYCSWWTDDSTTMIIVFKQDKSGLEEWTEANEGNILTRFERLQQQAENVSAMWSRVNPPVGDGAEGMGSEESSSEGEQEEQEEEEEEIDSDASDPELGGSPTEIDTMMGCMQFLKFDVYNAEERAEELKNRNLTPFRKALEELASGKELQEQCSRTMGVYQSYPSTSSSGESPASSPKVPSPRFEIWIRSRGSRQSPEVPMPEIRDPPRWKRPKKEDPTGLFQQLVEETEKLSLEDYAHHKALADKERVFLIAAYNFADGVITPLAIVNDYGKFHCNMNNRTLTVVTNNDFIEVFYLRQEDNKWERLYSPRLSSKSRLMCPLRYHPNSAPGFAAELPTPMTGDALKDLFDISAFHTPMIQDAKTLLYRDHEQWFRTYQIIRTEQPHITRCHLLSNHLLSVTLTYHFAAVHQRRPINHGIIVNLDNDRTTLYPNYTEFMNIMFDHHLPDLFARQFTYLCPHPVHLQPWFKYYFLDVNDPDDLCNYVKMKSLYDLMYERLKNNKCFANPLNDAEYYDDQGLDFMTNYIHTNQYTSLGLANIYSNRDGMKYTEKFFHPIDPIFLFRANSAWTMRMPEEDDKDVIVKEGAEL